MKRLLVLALVLASGQALAFNTLKYGYNGGTTVWASANVPVPWYLHPTGCADTGFDKSKAAIQAAFQSWQDVGCSTIAFSYAGTATSQPSLGIWLHFQNGYWDQSVDGAAAYSVTTEYTYAGNIKKNEVVFNDAELVWTDQDLGPYASQQDIQGVAAHELGHSIGLDHSFHIDATMFFSAGGADMRTLEQDDQNGACFLYPTASFTGGQVCDACASDGNCGGGGCLQYPDGQSYCGKSCTSDGQCPEHTFCYTQDGINSCVSDLVRCDQGGGQGAMGDYCWGMEVCQTGVCLALPGNAYCSKTCNPSGTNTCGSGWSCMGEGTSGYCIKAGQVAFGGTCATHLECSTSMCAQVCADKAICVKECTTDAQCPANATCQQEMCLPNGAVPFGGTCSCSIDCATGYCTGSFGGNFCSRSCSTATDCPESYCSGYGYCGKPSGTPGSGCAQDSNCGDTMFCKFTSPSKPEGTCTPKCDPVADTGCAAGQACVWYYMGWLDKVYGECKDANGGAGELQSCDPATHPCEVNFTCADAGKGLLCYRDCKTTSALGCKSGETCIGMNLPADPKHGLCIPGDQPVPDDEPDVVTPPDTATTDVVGPGDDTSPGWDTAAPYDTTGHADTTAGTDHGTTGGPDTTPAGDDATGGTPDRTDGGGSTGMCSHGAHGAPTPAWVLLAALALLLVARRRVIG